MLEQTHPKEVRGNGPKLLLKFSHHVLDDPLDLCTMFCSGWRGTKSVEFGLKAPNKVNVLDVRKVCDER